MAPQLGANHATSNEFTHSAASDSGCGIPRSVGDSASPYLECPLPVASGRSTCPLPDPIDSPPPVSKAKDVYENWIVYRNGDRNENENRNRNAANGNVAYAATWCCSASAYSHVLLCLFFLCEFSWSDHGKSMQHVLIKQYPIKDLQYGEYWQGN